MTLSHEVECDEAYVVAGHKGQPEVVQNKGRKGRRNRLKGKCGRGTLDKERPPVFGMIQRGGQIVINMIANVKQKTIEPFIKATIAPGTLVYTDEYGRSMPEMKMAMACVKSMSIPWKGFGHSCGAGCALIEVFHQRNFRSTSVSSSLFTMPENAGKHCCMHS